MGEFEMTNHVQRGPRGPYKIRKKLERALRHLADGRRFSEAAALSRMTTQGLRVALQKPNLLALVAENARAPVPKAVLTFERVMDLRLREPLPRT
jgi:hypothetical protein